MAKNQLNSKIESLIFSSNPNKIYKKIKKGAILEEDFEDVQTINDFINDKERNKRTKLRNNIDVYYIGALPQEFQTISEKLLNLISIQFSVNIRIQGELMVEKIYRKNQYKIYNLTKDIYYCINSQKNKIKKEERLQIYKENSNLIVELNSGEILDMLINFRNKSTLMILGLTAYNIFNPDIPDDTIMGFSSGDGASIVSLTECYDNKLKDVVIRNKNAFFEMVKTSLHELCHTIGIDHCVDYHCVMNSQYVKESYKNPIYFCPICLCKLYVGLNLGLEKRFNDLYQFYVNNNMEESALWIKNRINLWNKDKQNNNI
jgi:predicted Zn-dependent protease